MSSRHVQRMTSRYRCSWSHDRKMAKALTAKMQVVFAVTIFCAVLAVSCGEYIITHKPSNVDFLKDGGDIFVSDIPNVISATFGYDLDEDLTWEGLGQASMFQRPKANVLVSVAGVPASGLPLTNVAKYNTMQDMPEVSTEAVTRDILRTAEDGTPIIVDFSLEKSVFDLRAHHPILFRDLPTTLDKLRAVIQEGESYLTPADIGSLNITKDADIMFLGELTLIQGLSKALKAGPAPSSPRVPDFYHFQVKGLRDLVTQYGQGSAQVRDATTLLGALVENLTSVFRDVYDDNVVVQVVTMTTGDAVLSRRGRSLLQENVSTTATPFDGNYNVASIYTDDFPVAFNLLLWTMVILTLAVIGICYGIWFMDPGRDSIIYRMTSQRIKKE